MGQGMWPKVPDMRLPNTQNLSGGELFYIIENGIRFAGMPGWGTGTTDGELARLAESKDKNDNVTGAATTVQLGTAAKTTAKE